ncbi:MAG TPA: CotH kinase family protein [Cyclobacteriaceae bacterium]|nr:CotH kinase family protein [Cyclobacteriaceae bacterium]
MKKILYLFCLISLGTQLKAQDFADSNLPIVIITTDNNQFIPDEPKILGNMKIIYNGPGVRNYLTDQNTPSALNYNGRIGIETRGSTSQFSDKKPYSLTTLQPDNVTNNNVSLLGMPKENDWILNSLAFDASMIRDYISYNLSTMIGEYAPRTQYCEVIVNDSYRGLYILMEKIKVDDNRVDITKIKPTDSTLPDVTGGYITKADKISGVDVSAWIMVSYISDTINFIHEFPKPTDVTATQNNYIKSVFEKLASTTNNSSITNGYPSIIDIPSFVDFMLINELSANVDAYKYSTFFHKDKNAKLRAGPIWDLNLTYGNDLFFWGLDRSKTNLWQFDNGDNIGPKFWKDLFNNSQFKCYLSKRWNELTKAGQPLNLTSLSTYIDETVTLTSEAAARDNTKWFINNSGQIDGIKSFLSARITWMTTQLGSSSACSNITTPPLVINRISYNPSTTDEFKSSSDQEFVEIINNGSEPINLTGVYFSGTGFVYQFPASTILLPEGVIQLANDSDTFNDLYGYSPFGEFSRNLSNSSQKLTLADAFGNIIDEVEYSTESPWPDADGNGSYIKLKDASLDNNIGSNWEASTEVPFTNWVVTAVDEPLKLQVELFPNPVDETLEVSASGTITSLQFCDLQGRLLETIHPASTSVTHDISNYKSGIYLLTVKTKNNTVVRKVVKK